MCYKNFVLTKNQNFVLKKFRVKKTEKNLVLKN